MGVMSSSWSDFDDMSHLLFQRAARPVVPDALRGGLQSQEIKELRGARAALAGNWSSLANFSFAPIAGSPVIEDFEVLRPHLSNRHWERHPALFEHEDGPRVEWNASGGLAPPEERRLFARADEVIE